MTRRLFALVLAFVATACSVTAADDVATSGADLTGVSTDAVATSLVDRQTITEKKATCPFAGTAVESGALAVLNGVKRPIAWVKDIVALGDSGGGNLGSGVLQIFAKGNHARMASSDDDSTLDTAVPDGTFSLDFPGSQGSHPGHSGILEADWRTTSSGRFSQPDFDRLLAHAENGHITRSEVGKFIAENLARDPNSKVFGAKTILLLGKDLVSFAATVPSLDDTKLFEALTKLTGEDNLVGSAGEYGLLFAFLANSPNTIQVDGEPALSVDDVTGMFQQKQFPAGWNTWQKTRGDWILSTTALLHAAAVEYLRITG